MNKLKSFFTVFPLVFLLSLLLQCQREEITISIQADDTFYVENNGASMRVSVKGNTASGKIMLIVHGGPGGSSFLYHTKKMESLFEPHYAVAYWDQRTSSASQGAVNKETVTLPQFGDDLKKVFQVLKYRYGTATKVYLMSHSWGGMVATQFLTTGTNQELVAGWIFANAVHDWPLNDRNTINMIVSRGNQEIALGRNVAKWQEIIQYAQSLVLPISVEQSIKLSNYAWEAMDLIEGFTPLNEDEIIKENLITDKIPYTSLLFNLLNPVQRHLLREVNEKSFSSLLSNITTPILVPFSAPLERGLVLWYHIPKISGG
jgi:pimeloyl-ACP methyl ester carboxylesterase